MPHDKNGEPLKVGDKVTVECEITSICEGEFCTTMLQTVEVMPGNGEATTISAINAKQLVKLALVLVVLCLFAGDATAGLFARIRERRSGGCASAGCTPSHAPPASGVRAPAPAAPQSGGCAGVACPIK